MRGSLPCWLAEAAEPADAGWAGVGSASRVAVRESVTVLLERFRSWCTGTPARSFLTPETLEAFPGASLSGSRRRRRELAEGGRSPADLRAIPLECLSRCRAEAAR
ncbi:hypothetical protein ACFPRL_05335 [Pseudoclavibacter helvolus]